MADPTDLTLPLTPAKLGRAVSEIVERAIPAPRGENCMAVGEMERALTALCGEAVQAAYDDASSETERHRIEARDSARHAGRLMRLTAGLHALISVMPEGPQKRDAVNLIAAEADQSPWLADQIREADHG